MSVAARATPANDRSRLVLPGLDPSLCPNLYLVGMPKCGTTSVAHFLAQHEEVYLPPTKEPFFWSSDLPAFAGLSGIHSAQAYGALYERGRDARFRMDASTHYLISEVATSRIAASAPSPRALVCLRPPADIVVRWHQQMLRAGYEDRPDLAEAWSLVERRRAGEEIPRECIEPSLLDYRRIGAVGSHLERLATAFPKDGTVAIVFQEELRADPQGVYSALCDFLGLRADPSVDLAVRNAATVARNSALRRVARAGPTRAAAALATRVLPDRMVDGARQSLRGLIYRRAPRGEVDAAVVAKIASALAPERLRAIGTLRSQFAPWFERIDIDEVF